MVTEEADFIVVVEGRMTLIVVKTLTAPTTMIVVEDTEEDIVVVVDVPIVEDATMEAMEDATKIDSNHILMKFKKFT